MLAKTREKAYYLLADDIYFEEIDKNTIITRKVFLDAKRLMQPFNVMKYIIFNVKDKYTTKQIYELVQILRKDTTIIVSIFNPRKKEVMLLYVSNKDDYLLEKHIKTFLELEEI